MTKSVNQTRMANQQKESSKLTIKSSYNRHFSDAFRRKKVADIEAGLLSIKDLCAQYSISRTSVYRWIYRYSAHHKRGTRQVIEMKSEAHKTQLLLQRVAELEQVVGRKQIELDFANKVIAFASDELGYDLKKNTERKFLNSSESSSPNPTP